MANLTEARNTVELAPNKSIVLTAGTATIYPGAMVGVDANGKAVPAGNGTTVVGRAENYAIAGGTVTAKRGAFLFANDTTNPVTAAAIGKDCYVVDDHTVAISGSTASAVAGKVVSVGTDGVGVSISF